VVLGNKQATASNSSIAITGDMKDSTIEIGFSKKEYESGLRELESRVTEQLSRIYEKEIDRANDRANAETRRCIELELQLKQIREKLSALDLAYAQTIESLQDSAKTISRLRISNSAALDKTLKAISLGPRQAFDAWREIANTECLEPKVLFEAGKMAEINFDYGEALKLYLRTNDIEKNSKHLNAVGHLYFLMGRYPEATDKHSDALDFYPAVEDDAFKATLQHNLAELYSANGEYDKAEPLFKSALAIREKNKLTELVASTKNSLAGLYKQQGQHSGRYKLYKDAEVLYVSAIKLFEKSLGGHHPNTLWAKNNLGLLYLAKRDFNSAKTLLESVLETTKRYRGNKHHDTGLAMSSLAGVYQDQNNLKKAEKLHTSAKKIFEYVIGKNHPHVAMTMNNLAGIAFARKSYRKAVKRYRKALTIYRKTHGDGHHRTLSIVNQLNMAERKLAESGG